MAININVNGQSIDYPEIGDTNWADEATDFAVQTASAFGKIGLSIGTTVDIPGTLDVTGNTTLDANLSVTGNATITGNLTANGNTNLGNASGDTIAVTGILNVDSGVLYVNPTSNQVGINKTNPSQALDVVGNVAITGNETVGGTLNVTGATSLSTSLAVTGNATIGNLTVFGSTTLGDESGDSLTINSNGVSIPNGLNFDNNTLVIDATNNRVGIGVSSPTVALDLTGGVLFKNSDTFSGINIRNTSDSATSQRASVIDFQNNLGIIDSSIHAYHNTNGSCDLILFTTPAGSRSSDRRIQSFIVSGGGQISAVVPGGSTPYPGYLCRAWVNFNGTGTVAIRASGNVTSITDNGLGNYTMNFTTAMPDANYSVYCSCSYVTGASNPKFGSLGISAPTVNGANILTLDETFNSRDSSFVTAAIFR